VKSKNQNNLDYYLKTKSEFFIMKHQIRPSANFTALTLEKLEKAGDRQALIAKILIVSYMFIPFILREIWFFARRDYFSLTRWPLGNYLSDAYNFLIAGSTANYMLILGIASALMYLWGYRLLNPAFKYVGQFFQKNQAQA